MSLAYNEKKGCPDGYHKRKSYLSALGFRGKPRCIKSTTSKNKEKRAETRKKNLYVPSIKSLARKACPPGMIERRGYVRKYTTAVRQKGFTVRKATGKSYRVYPKASPSSVNSVCVKDTGKPGKGVPKSIGPLRKGELSKHGYSFRDGEEKRRAALRRAVEDYGALGVFRKLDAVAKLTVRTVPAASEIYKKDREWIQSKYAPLKAP